jgi:hypothetical protein
VQFISDIKLIKMGYGNNGLGDIKWKN